MLFVTRYEDVVSLKTRLKKTGADRSGWISEYLDPVTNERWFDVFQDVDGRMPTILRRADLPQDLGQLIHEALTSPREDDWYGLAVYFNSEGVDAEQLFSVLTTKRGDLIPSALKAFGRALELPDKRHITGMTIAEVDSSYKRYLFLKGEIKKLTNGV